MIKTEGLATTVTCGKGGKANIAVTGKANDYEAKLVLQQLNDGVKIGDTPTPEQIQELPSITIEFFQVESVEAYIAALQGIKDRMNRRMQYAMAC